MACGLHGMGMKNLLLSGIAACVLTALVGCSSDHGQSSTTSSQSAPMQTDTKNMQPTH
jgi:hypothetical protein